MKSFTYKALTYPDMNFKGHFLDRFVWPMISSRTGEVYDVTLTNKGFTCTCIGFNRFGKCKHITSVHDQLVAD
jgi:hypothetical protein